MAFECLINAVDAYDVNKGYRFSSYAVPCIVNGIKNIWKKEEKNNNYRTRIDYIRYNVYKNREMEKTGKAPSDEEMKSFLEIDDKKLEEIKQYMNYHEKISLDELLKDDEEIIEERIEKLQDDETLEEIENNPILNGVYVDDDNDIKDKIIGTEPKKTDMGAIIPLEKDEINDLLGLLTPIEADILKERLGLENNTPKTCKQIGMKYNFPASKVRYVEQRALQKLLFIGKKRKFQFFLRGIEDEEWINYLDLYDMDRPADEIVDGIRVEEENSHDDNKNTGMEKFDEENKTEQLNENESEKNSIEEYKVEIIEALNRIDDLDKLISKTSEGIKKEKEEKKKNSKKIEEPNKEEKGNS